MRNTDRISVTCSGCAYRYTRPARRAISSFCASCGRKHNLSDLDIKMVVKHPKVGILRMIGQAVQRYRALNPDKPDWQISQMHCLVSDIRHRATNWESVLRILGPEEEENRSLDYLRLRLAFTRAIRSRVYTDPDSPVERAFQSTLRMEEEELLDAIGNYRLLRKYVEEDRRSDAVDEMTRHLLFQAGDRRAKLAAQGIAESPLRILTNTYRRLRRRGVESDTLFAAYETAKRIALKTEGETVIARS